MRGYVVRVMQLGNAYTPLRDIEVVTIKDSLTDLILNIGHLSERPAYWDVFYVEGEIMPMNSMQLDPDYVAKDGIPVKIQYALMHGSLVFTTEGFTLYQRFGSAPKDIPF